MRVPAVLVSPTVSNMLIWKVKYAVVGSSHWSLVIGILQTRTPELLKELPDEWNDYEAIIGDHTHLDYIKWIKVIKYGKIAFLRNPLVIFKNKRNIRFQFDLFHGNGVLDKAIELLSEKDRQDFKKFVFTNTSYNQGNMFICKSKEIINEYYKTIFKWLYDCEQIFGFSLDGYAKTRVYAFLAERFLPYWFNKYVKTLEWPIVFNDLNSDLNKWEIKLSIF